ncbi:hypothetical protein OIU84_022709 [Salix udensis]|uniref:Uncharacterized protein n=1 Tax=Salix udensis TaxID=889485 RepID=A0AAD6KQL1_9ROSI|nr:hypothetical protein OIU84_022709 [Salix udensis]
MGFFRKVSKTGSRFIPKLVVQPDTVPDEVSENFKGRSVIGSKSETSTRTRQGDTDEGAEDVLAVSSLSLLVKHLAYLHVGLIQLIAYLL